ncbi:integrase-like protein [Kribbella sp. VKM Ac-2571]|nr:integrase-like protein [Kribbella sp. VKM Ac-2571]
MWFERPGPMQLWQMDIVGGIQLVNPATGELRGAKVVTAVDDHSRYCVIAKVVERATARAVCLALAEALVRFGVPEEIITDNGKQFTDQAWTDARVAPRHCAGATNRPSRANFAERHIDAERAVAGLDHELNRIERQYRSQPVRSEHQARPPVSVQQAVHQVVHEVAQPFDFGRLRAMMGGQAAAAAAIKPSAGPATTRRQTTAAGPATNTPATNTPAGRNPMVASHRRHCSAIVRPAPQEGSP